jgi:dephospho-CoA kinase
MTIELIGLPGSGKSHISRLLAGRLCQAGLPAEEPTRIIGHSSGLKRIASKSGYVLLFLLYHPLLTVRTKLAVARTRQSSCRNLFKSLFNMLFIHGLLLTSCRRNRIVLLDQGVIQALASVHFGSLRRLPESFLASLPVPDLVLRVIASPGTLVARLTSRAAGGGSRVEADPGAELPRFEAALESLTGQPPLSGAEIIEIQNDGDDEALSRDLDELVRRIAEVYNARK